ncbi:PREDICTED: N-lysine methyltransferase SETD8-A-like [Priapulus caudatus]|uniref:N-lysine methyltransferase SETD8-A-like n=1 Tax=Priapulus caudatus TaxID=37621 RepID=A0ABM1EK58_PRICU|nr:PREDICTED: N-lysine methyltransferase SETD8-A-like [Priapulus caudatus]
MTFDFRSMSRRQKPEKVAKLFITKDEDPPGLARHFISEKIGYGVFAEKKVMRSDFLLEYHGEIITEEEATTREKLYIEQNKGSFLYFFRFGKQDLCVDATHDDGRLCRLVNDGVGTDINCSMKVLNVTGQPKLCLFACCDIPIGQELRYDYNDPNLPWRSMKKKWKKNYISMMFIDMFH